MNFNSVFEELNKLYESNESKIKLDIMYAKDLALDMGNGKKAYSSLLKNAKEVELVNCKRATPEQLRKITSTLDELGIKYTYDAKLCAGAEEVEEGCNKKALKEAADDEIEFAEEPVDVIPEEETEEVPVEEEIPKEDVNTVEEFLKSFGEYDGKLKLEFKPIVIDDKEYQVTGIIWDDSEEGKLVAEVIFDMSDVEEDHVEEEPVDEE
jgi:hypothetical protein